MNSELQVVIALMLAALSLELLAVFIVIRWLIRRARKKENTKITPFGKGVIACGIAGVLCFLYSLLIEPFWLEVTHTHIQSTKIPPGSKGLRIAHLSDLHSDSQVRLEESLPKAIAAEKPDLIVFTGDCINSPEGLPVFKNCLKKISEIAPTYVVKGNWDAWYWNKLDVFGNTDAVELNGDAKEIIVNGIPLSIVGLSVDGKRNPNPEGGSVVIQRALNEMNSTKQLSIFLYHYPNLIEEVSKKDIDLYFAGHTHGGQVRLPFYGALVTLSKYGKRFEAGLYRVKDTSVYVSRGIGMEGGIAPRMRFLCRPELAIIDVKSPTHN